MAILAPSWCRMRSPAKSRWAVVACRASTRRGSVWECEAFIYPETLKGQMTPDLRTFVEEQHWTFAKTMREWPHEYIVRDRVDEELFERLAIHIREHGVEGRFYEKVITYYEEAGLVYWTMGAPLRETFIVNRCWSEDTYERRLAEGALPVVRW